MAVNINGSTGMTTNSGAVYDGLQTGTAVTASGTSVDFTGIPSWVERITVMFSGVSVSGTSNIQVQLGDSGGIETSGYVGNAILQGTANLSLSAGFAASLSNASTYLWHGTLTLTKVFPETWVGNGQFAIPGGVGGGAANVFVAGSKPLSATLDRLRVTTVNGTDTFDAGTINIIYE